MAWLAISGIDLSAIAAAMSEPKGDRRDIGDVSPANDGSLRATRQTRKHDLSFTTIPLSGTDAFAWEALIVGDGERFSFDSSLYGSKGTGPNVGYVAAQNGGTPKFGGGVLRVTAGIGTITYPVAANASGGTAAGWTVMVWRYESAVWHHYAITSAGHKWVDGVRNDAASTTWLSVSGANVTITNGGGSDQDYDDLVVLPCVVPDSWPPLVYGLGSAFGNPPYLTVAGLLVPEAATRTMVGKCSIAKVLRANPGSGLAKDVQVLQVDLMEK